MFAASARHTNAGIAARQIALPVTHRPAARDQIIEGLKLRIVRLESENRRLLQDLREQEAVLTERVRRELTVGFQVSAAEVIAEISMHHKIPVALIKGPRRAAPLIIARHHAIYEVARRCCWLSLPAIGRSFGGRDHTTILHAIREWPQKAAKLGIECIPLEVR